MSENISPVLFPLKLKPPSFVQFQVNQGFLTLRHHIPEGFRMKKMSKVDTLRSALEYIRSLEEILVQVPAEHQSPFTEFEPCIFPPETEASLDSTKEN